VAEHADPVQSISAVTLLTRDMRSAVPFYEALGFRLLYGGADAPFTSFKVGGNYLNLQLEEDLPSLNHIWGRIVFWVVDVDEMFERARVARLETQTSPADAPWGERYFHLRDPDGHELSFARPLPGG
jgi:catechol 2,3-dioxygenase-like lactoylglutathione lyase family enzyme